MVSISCVKTKKELDSFIEFPEKLYKNHPLWVPPLRMDERNTLKKTAPAFRHCEAEYFLAHKNGEIVGRVAAIINHVANTDWKENVVRFGWIDFVDDYEVSAALIKAVLDWGKEKGMDYIKGPLGFSDMDKEGLLVEGFDKLPSITCIYNYPYYVDHLEKLGFVKDHLNAFITISITNSCHVAASSDPMQERKNKYYQILYLTACAVFQK